MIIRSVRILQFATFSNQPIFRTIISSPHTRKYNLFANNTIQHRNMSTVRYLSPAEAQKIDDELMGEVIGYQTEQLMELAGLSVATAIGKEYDSEKHQAVLVISGPGNNGGDGLIAARHLSGFGFSPSVYYPKRVNSSHYKNLLKQCEAYKIPFLDDLPSSENINGRFDLVVDAIFGFNFKGDLRAPFDKVLDILQTVKKPVIAVDVPSGWDVEKGNIHNRFTPAVVVSLGSPKKCVENFKGIHYLGGRFVPRSFSEKHNLNLPKYPGTDVIARL